MAVLTISKPQFEKYTREIRKGALSPRGLSSIVEIFNKTSDPAGRFRSGRLLLDVTLRCSENSLVPAGLQETKKRLAEESLPTLLRSENATVSNGIFGSVVAKIFGSDQVNAHQINFMNGILSNAREGAAGQTKRRIEEALGIGLRIEAKAKKK